MVGDNLAEHWLNPLLHFINAILDPIGIVIGLILAIPVFWTWWEIVFGRRRREQRYLRAIRETPGQRTGILIVDLLPGRNIRAAVENFCQQDALLKTVATPQIFYLTLDGVKPADVLGLKQQIRQIHQAIAAQGIDRLHYFHAGPSMAAAMVGAELANACLVQLYQHEGDHYLDFGVLKLPVMYSQ